MVCCAVNFNVHLWHAQTINFHKRETECSNAKEIDCTSKSVDVQPTALLLEAASRLVITQLAYFFQPLPEAFYCHCSSAQHSALVCPATW